MGVLCSTCVSVYRLETGSQLGTAWGDFSSHVPTVKDIWHCLIILIFMIMCHNCHFLSEKKEVKVVSTLWTIADFNLEKLYQMCKCKHCFPVIKIEWVECILPLWDGLDVSIFASHVVGYGFVSWLGYTKIIKMIQTASLLGTFALG